VITTILTDIEGTTSSISFVKDILFPYARERLPAFIVTHTDTPEVQHWLHDAAKEAGLISATQQEMIALLQRWIDEDRKSTALKALQGMIWQAGYAAGDYRAHIYPDAVRALREWHAQGIKLYVYSSGSIQAQELFFGNCEAGDLRDVFSGFFDTTSGPKRETDSYRNILSVIGVPADQVLFLSDTVEELDAARSAGLATMLLARPPLICSAPEVGGHRCIDSFEKISLT